MALVICPGFHSPTLTASFVAQLKSGFPSSPLSCWVYPAPVEQPWSAYALRQFLARQGASPLTPLVLIGFSAGCVAAIAAAHYGVRQGWPISAVIALDGWGVPLVGDFTGYRLSHDAFTHRTSGWGEPHRVRFYAAPPVEHLTLWEHPARVTGWQTAPSPSKDACRLQKTTALAFLIRCLQQHPEALRQ